MRERGDALPCLALAHDAHQRCGDVHAAVLDAHIALAMGVIDIGAMDRVDDWLARAAALDGVAGQRQPPGVAQPAPHETLWLQLGQLARLVLGAGAADAAQADAAAAALTEQLQSMPPVWSPDECLMVAVLLVHTRFTQQRYEQFDFIATLVEHPPLFDRASAVMRARWHYISGFANYQIGKAERAEAAWSQGLALAHAQGLAPSSLLLSLAMLRLLLDRGRLEEAERVQAQVQPQWGAGRVRQLIELQQMRARLHLLRERPALALATVDEALALATQSKLSELERASCLTDRAQMLVALKRSAEAIDSLRHLAAAHRDRDADVFACLHGLLCAWRLHQEDEAAARQHLRDALALAQRSRYTMFLRLLPKLAAQVCALALRWGIENAFVVEVIRARSLPAPPGADAAWPWAVWLRLLGGFELQLNGERQQRPGKQQAKPLELLRAMACESTLTLGQQQACDALWPDADGAGARKSFDMTVQRLRRLLGDDSLVHVGDGRVALDATRVSADVVQRRVLIERIEALAMQPRVAVAAAALVQTELATLVAAVVALSRGLLLPGAPEAPWLLAERTRTQRELRRAADAVHALLARDGVSSDTSGGTSGGDGQPLLAALRELSER